MRKSELRRRLKACQDARRENGEHLSRIIMNVDTAREAFKAQAEELQQQLAEMTSDRDGWRALAESLGSARRDALVNVREALRNGIPVWEQNDWRVCSHTDVLQVLDTSLEVLT
jgi:hypothetical protein